MSTHYEATKTKRIVLRVSVRIQVYVVARHV